MTNKPAEIQLLVLSDYGGKELINQKGTSIQAIRETMETLDWSVFHQVVLSKSNSDWIEVGGNLNEDGLACVYVENDEIYVTEQAPTSIAQLTEILVSYFEGSGKYKIEYSFTSGSDERKNKEEDKRRLEQWRKKFLKEKRKDDLANIKKAIFSLLAIFAIFFTIYYWYIGELQFIGQETELVKAEVVNTRMHHIGHGAYMQTVTYEFEYNDESYQGTFEAGKLIGKQEVGNYVQIKFSTSNPNRSKMTGIYRNYRNH